MGRGCYIEGWLPSAARPYPEVRSRRARECLLRLCSGQTRNQAETTHVDAYGRRNADAGSIPAASTTNMPGTLMFSDHRNGATQSRLKTARTSRAAPSLGFRRCYCAFSESVRPEINELFVAALDRSTSSGRPNLDEDSVSQWVVIPCNMHLAMRKRSESWQAQNSDTRSPHGFADRVNWPPRFGRRLSQRKASDLRTRSTGCI